MLPKEKEKLVFRIVLLFLFFHHFCEKIECQEIVLDEILLKERKNSLSPNERKVFFALILEKDFFIIFEILKH